MMQILIQEHILKKPLWLHFRTGGDVTSRQVIYEQGGGSNGLNIYIEGDNLYFGAWALTYGWPFVSVSSPIAINTEYYAILELDTENQVLKGVLNGTTVGTVALDTDDALGPHGGDCALGAQRNASYFHSVGADGGASSYYFGGDIMEFLSYNYLLNDADEIIVENYFTAKYRAQLETDIVNDYYSHRATHDYEVFGIGQEDASNTPHNFTGFRHNQARSTY
jgi:hypothetical protein